MRCYDGALLDKVTWTREVALQTQQENSATNVLTNPPLAETSMILYITAAREVAKAKGFTGV